MVDRSYIRLPLRIGGTYLRAICEFISTESALDSGPGETPPFDAVYGPPRIGHYKVDHQGTASPLDALITRISLEIGFPSVVEARLDR